MVLWIEQGKGFAEHRSLAVARHSVTSWRGCKEKQAPVFVVATAGRRPTTASRAHAQGPIRRRLFVDLPDVHGRLQILEVHLRVRERDPHSANLAGENEETNRFSGAEHRASRGVAFAFGPSQRTGATRILSGLLGTQGRCPSRWTTASSDSVSGRGLGAGQAQTGIQVDFFERGKRVE